MPAPTEMVEQLAVIRNFHIGISDRGVPAIWFDTYITEGSAACWWIYGAEEIHQFIIDAGLEDLTRVNGRTCWVDVGNGMIIYKRMAKI